MEVQFVNPSSELAAHQRARTLEYMVRELRASDANIDSPRGVAITLAKARFDPALIALLGGQAAKIVKSARKGPGTLLHCIAATSMFIVTQAGLLDFVSATLVVIG